MPENSGRHIQYVIEASQCRRHQAEKGEACWDIPGITGYLRAVCSRRASSAWVQATGKPIAKVNHGNRGQKKEVA